MPSPARRELDVIVAGEADIHLLIRAFSIARHDASAARSRVRERVSA
jgi:hypothetical protein